MSIINGINAEVGPKALLNLIRAKDPSQAESKMWLDIMKKYPRLSVSKY